MNIYYWNLYKIADIGDQQKIHMQFWTTVKSLPRDSFGNKSNCDHPDTLFSKATTVM